MVAMKGALMAGQVAVATVVLKVELLEEARGAQREA